MKNVRNLFAVTIVTVVLLAGLSGSAVAGASANGKFTLAADTHWGLAVLPAGTYEYSVEQRSAALLVSVRSLDGKTSAMIVPQSLSMGESPEGSYLTLAHKGDVTFVSAFALKDLGVTLNYNPPSEKMLMTARSRTPVSMTAGMK